MFISAYLETKYLGWVLIQTEHLIETGELIVKKMKYKQRKWQASKIFTKTPSKIYHRNLSLSFDQINAQLYLDDHLRFVNETTRNFLASRKFV